MKNKIYLTQEGKEEIENYIAELEKEESSNLSQNLIGFANMNHGFIDALKEILASAIILPVEESWKFVAVKTMILPATESYPQGVIIQSK